VCAGDYVDNCDSAAGTPLKSGILQDYWPEGTDPDDAEARFGLMDFNNDGSPSTSTPCIPESNASSFFTNVQNAVPVNVTTELVNGLYWGIRLFRGDMNASCDPLTGDTETCRKNFILVLTGGNGADTPAVAYDPGTGTGDAYVFGDHELASAPAVTLPPECSSLTNNLSINACYGYEVDHHDNDGTQNVSLYIVNAMGVNGDILAEAASVGGGNYYNVTEPSQLRDELKQALQDIIKRAASGTAASVLASGEGSGANLVQAVFYPRRRFRDTATGAYDEILWVGRLSNFWYYVDPYFEYSNMREERNDELATYLDNAKYVLDLTEDYVAVLEYDEINEQVMATRQEDTDADGGGDVAVDPDVTFEDLGSMWEAGEALWNRDIAADPRTIYFNISNSASMAIFNSTEYNAASAAERAEFNTYVQAVDDAEALDIINYLNGEDVAGYRGRTVDATGDGIKRVWKLGDVLNSTPKIVSFIPNNKYDEVYGYLGYEQTYEDFYNDVAKDADLVTYPLGSSERYKNRGMVFAGGNDGMLHAFKLGRLEVEWSGQVDDRKGRLMCVDLAGNYIECTDLGREMWAFIPKNALPYLKYQLDGGYCHVFTVDLSPYIFDASINPPAGCVEADPAECTKTEESWRTVLIGGMRYGGACRNLGTACSMDMDELDDAGAIDDYDCVNTPVDGLGLSSYFALDITDPENPTFLWEFNDPGLGFTTTGPAVIRQSARKVNASGTDVENDHTKNGYWFVVLGSGPTGPIDTNADQFLGRSDQNLKYFVLDLKTGALEATIDTGVENAFAGSMINVSQDVDFDYQDDVLYTGYVKKNSVANPDTGTFYWTQGGVGRLVMKEDLFQNPGSPASSINLTRERFEFQWSPVIDDIGPVTAAVAMLQDNEANVLWLYFGSGRYFYEVDKDPGGSNTGSDDPDGARAIFGITDPCYNGATGNFTYSDEPTRNIDCSGVAYEVTLADLDNMTDLENIVLYSSGARRGWYINLDPTGTYDVLDEETWEPTGETIDFSAERVITDPLSSITEIVYFTTYKPYADLCSISGESYLWAVQYSTGGSAEALMKGSALIQVSTGAIEKVDLSTQFGGKGGRRSSSMTGKPPTAQGLSIFSTPPPEERVIHIKER
jgi:type IV pilus assembly protein PilY1